jgi:hypothetical protein
MGKRACIHCGKGPSQGVELRPYAAGGALTCFRCAHETPERKAEAQRQMAAALGALEGGAVLTSDGPQSPEAVAAGMRCDTCKNEPSSVEVAAIARSLRTGAPPPGGRPPEILGFLCAACALKSRPYVCTRCSQPIALGGQIAVDAAGRPRHAGPCPDWLAALRGEG